MPGGHNPFALASTEWDGSEEARVIQSSSAKPKGTLRRRASSLKQPRLPALSTQLADELHMRFWSLGNGTNPRDTSKSGALRGSFVLLPSLYTSVAFTDAHMHSNVEAHGPRST